MPTRVIPYDTQDHLLHDGRKVSINRSIKHKYWLTSNPGEQMPGATAITGSIGSNFGAGMNWTRKLIRHAMFPELEELEELRREQRRKQTGSVAREEEIAWLQKSRALVWPRLYSEEIMLGYADTAATSSQNSTDAGTQVHDDIHQWISTGKINEESPHLPLFMHWLNQVGEKVNFTVSEKFLYNPHMFPKYGGTLDAYSLATVWDWKVKLTEKSYAKYGSSPRDLAQLSAYALALKAMGSAYRPSRGFLAYILQSGVDIVEVDLNIGAKLFTAAHQLYALLEGAK